MRSDLPSEEKRSGSIALEDLGDESMNEALLRDWDGEAVIIRHDKPSDAWIYIAIHSSRLGPATGGTRMIHYDDQEEALADALNLAAGMTYKFAVPGLERGGGKAVISLSDNLEGTARADLLRRHGELIHQLGGLYYTGPDVGTSDADMDIIAETGAPYVFCRTPEAGGAGSSAPATALGVFTGIEAACEYACDDASLADKKVLIQGAGAVGRILIDHLREAGAEILFNDIDEDTIRYFAEEQGLPFVAAEHLYSTDCDVFAPCALGGILNKDTIPQLKCQIIAGGANNQLADPRDAERLRDRGIIYAPDYVVNVGGAMAITGIEISGWTPEEASEKVATSVKSALRRIFEMADSGDITTDEAARRIAEANLAQSV
jgi:leucine dehydrogenase